MTRPKKKEKERRQLQSALARLNVEFRLLDARESPDFLIEVDGRKIGIELTAIHKQASGSTSAKVDSDVSRVMKEAVEEYDRQGGAPLVFWADVNERFFPKNRRDAVQSSSQLLIDKVGKQHPSGIFGYKRVFTKSETDSSASFVERVSASPSNCDTSGSITLSRFVDEQLDPSALVSNLKHKEGRLSEYRSVCDEIWLLAVLPSLCMASGFRLRDFQPNHVCSSFDGVIIFDEHEDRAKFLAVVRS